MKTLIAILLMTIIIIIGLSMYLAPDELSGCKDRPTSAGCRRADAIIAVSGGDTAARTHEAVRLYNDGWSDTLIFSGAAYDKSGPSNASVMRQLAIDAGVSPSDILVEEFGETTKQNAEKTSRLLQDRQIERVILVTSAYHQRRASLEFAKRFDGRVTIVSHPVATDSQWSIWWWTTPQGWYLAVGELIKIILFYAGGTR